MVPVAGRPFLEYVLDGLITGGIRSITLSVGYKAETIQAHFGNSYRGAIIEYAIEPYPLGTGGAIENALGDNECPALVLNGDTLVRIDFDRLVDWYQSDPVPVAIVLRQMNNVARYGAAILQGEHISGFAEKGLSGPGYINAGVYVINPAVFSSFDLPEKFGFESEVLQKHCEELRPRAYLTQAYFIDIGIPADLERANVELGIRAG